jgi:hypothetical protein
MAKRFTDTEKWKDDWYLSLSNDDKIVWQWLLDNCSHAGFCKKSISLLNMMCRVSYTEQQVLEKMKDRVISVNNQWFIPKFIRFQYSTLLSAKPAIISVVKELFDNNCVEIISKSFGNDYTIISKSFENHCKMIKDKVKDMDKVKDNKGGVGENKNIKGVRIEDGYVYFTDNSKQPLGADQKALYEMGQLKAKDVIKGFIN